MWRNSVRWPTLDPSTLPGVMGRQELMLQILLQLRDQSTVFVHALHIVRPVPLLQDVECFDSQAVPFTHLSKRFIAERQPQNLLTPIREELADPGHMRRCRRQCLRSELMPAEATVDPVHSASGQCLPDLFSSTLVSSTLDLASRSIRVGDAKSAKKHVTVTAP